MISLTMDRYKDRNWLQAAIAMTRNHPTEDEECLDHCDDPECDICIGVEQCCQPPKEKQKGE